MPSASVQQTLAVLRDGSNFSWPVITLFAVVMYVFAVEIDRGNVRGVLAGAAFWAADMFNEIWNGLVFHFNHFAPAWSVRGESSLVLLIGLNIEITFMFAIGGIVATKGLPESREVRVMGVPNRWFFAVVWSLVAVGVECWLNSIGVLVWELSWWNAQRPYLIFFLGYLPFYVIAYWVYDIPERVRQVRAVVTLVGIDVAALVILGGLGWI